MTLNPESLTQFNLKDAAVLLVEPSSMGMEILVQVMVGFGARGLVKCDAIEKAKWHISQTQFDLMVIDALPGDQDGYDFVRWLRRRGSGANRFAPVIVVSSHTSVEKVAGARDSGAHFIVAKPIKPQTLLERILWIVREGRPFVSSAAYAGPERRFKFAGPPVNTTGRRETDLSGHVGDATEPNMSQDQIDGLLSPVKAAL